MKISFITTVLNEEKTINLLLDSLVRQTKKPDEIIIVDGGSTDKTIKIIQNSKFKIQKYLPAGRHGNSKLKILLNNNINRSQGRNEAIKKATGEIIAVSDAGCFLDKNWLEEIVKPFTKNTTSFIRRGLAPDVTSGFQQGHAFNTIPDVAAGFYRPSGKTVFQKCLACYTSVMEDKIDEKNFLPSSRSMAFKKSVWQKVGGYPENLDYCEDLIFSQRLKEAGFKFKFVKKAFVYWRQKENLPEAFSQFFHYAFGDFQARYWPHLRKITLVYGRYALGVGIVWKIGVIGGIGVMGIYFLWAIGKNYRYVNNLQALFWLPILQITADLAVMLGILGAFKNET